MVFQPTPKSGAAENRRYASRSGIMQKAFAAVALLATVSACTSSRGFDRGALSSALAPEEVVTEKDIQRVLYLRAQLPRPFKLGIFFKQGTRIQSDRYVHHWAGWEWQPSDKQKVLDVGPSLKRDGLVSEIVFISSETIGGQDLKSIRLAAARHGVDAVMVVTGVADVDRYNNALGPTYALIITPLFVPGTVVDALFVSHAGLWDVRNEFLYASAEADGSASQTRAAAMVREDAVVALARERSINELSAAMLQHIKNLGQ